MDVGVAALFFSSGGVTERPSLAALGCGVGVWAEPAGCDAGDEFLAADAFLPFFSTLFGTKTSKVGGSFSGVPSCPGEKDRKEQ